MDYTGLHVSIFNELPYPCFLLQVNNHNMIIIEVNEAGAMAFDSNVRQITNRDLIELLSTSTESLDLSPTIFREKITALLQTGEPHTIPYQAANPIDQRYDDFKISPVRFMDKDFILFSFREVSLKAKINELDIFIQQSHDVICVVDSEGIFQRISPSCESVWGYTPKELIGQPFMKYVHPNDRDFTKKEATRITKEKNTIGFENRYLHKDGSVVYILWSTYWDSKEQVSYSIARDITTERNREIESKLFSSISSIFTEDSLGSDQVMCKILKLLSEYGGFPITEFWMVGKDKKKIYLSSHFSESKFTQFSKESAEIDTFKKGEGLPGTVWKRNEAVFWKRLPARKSFVRNKAAKKCNIRTGYGIPLKVDHQLIGTILLLSSEYENKVNPFTEIVERVGKHISSELARMNAVDELDNMFTLSPDILALITKKGEIKKINDAVETILKYKKKSVLNQSIFEYLLTDRNSLSKKKIKELLLKKGTHQFEGKFLTHNKNIKWLSWTINTSADENLIYCVAKDITYNKNLEEIVDNASNLAKVGAWDIDLINNKVYWSPMMHKIFETEKDFIPDMDNSMEFFTSGNNRKAILERLYNAIENNENWNFEIEIITAKGNKKWIRSIGETKVQDNKTYRIYGSVQDITTRRNIELDKIKLLEERNAILDNISDGFYSLDENLRFTYFNKEAENILNINSKNIIGNTIWKVFSPEKNKEIEEAYKQASKTKESVYLEYFDTWINKWLEVNIYPGEDTISVYFKDVTDRVNMIDNLKLSNERFIKVSEATKDIIWDWDIENNLFTWSDRYTEVFGKKVAQQSKSLSDLEKHIHPDDLEKLVTGLENVLEDEKKDKWYAEYRQRNSDGDYLHIFDRGLVIRDKNGNPTRMVGAMQDVTKERENEKSLKELNLNLHKQKKQLEISNESLEQFAYIASHDLQEPLRMVSSFLTLLEKKYGEQLDEDARQYIFYATDGAKRMRTILLDLLEYSRAGEIEDKMEKVDLNEVVKEVELLYSTLLENLNATIELEQLPVVTSCHSPIRQVFQNIISNSLKYQKKGASPQIKISALEKEDHHEISIQDNGIGIHQDSLDDIFGVFKRLHSQSDYPGSGMGLAIVKKILNNMGEDIRVESTVSKGSKFYFTVRKR